MSRRLSSTGAERLSLYYRRLASFSDPEAFISSEELAEAISHSAAQVRRDLSCFGTFGTPGRGYRVGELRNRLERAMGKVRSQNVILVGAGNLGMALLSYKGFRHHRYEIVAAFDSDLRKIGKRLEGLEIQDLQTLRPVVASTGAKMAIVSVPAGEAQRTIDRLISAGIHAILNFAPIQAVVPESVKLLNVDLSVEMDRLCYLMRGQHPWDDEEAESVETVLFDETPSEDGQSASRTSSGRSQAISSFPDL